MNPLLNRAGNVLAAIVARMIRYRWVVLIAAIAVSAISLRYAATNLGINTDTANMIAPELQWREAFDAYRNKFPIRDRNLVVVVEARDGFEAQQAASDLAAGMRAEPQLFSSVFLAGDGEFFARNGLLYLPVADLESLSDRLVAAQPLLGQLASRPNGAGVLEVLALALEQTGSVGAEEPTADLQDAVAQALEAHNRNASQSLDWRTLLATGNEPASRQLILVRPTLDFDRVRPARDAIERIRAMIADAGFSEAVSVRLTGTIAMEHEELDSVVRSASFAGVLALIMVVAVLYWALRSVRLLGIAVFVLFAGLAVTAALAAVLVGHLNLLSVAFAVLYVGLGVDFIVHVCLRVREELAANADIDAAIVCAMRGIGASLVICTLTTAAGFYAFVPSRLFEGISELGLISGTGMFVSLLVSVTVLPALLAIAYRTRNESVRSDFGLRLTSGAVRRAPSVAVVFAAVVLLAAVSLPRVYFDSNPVNLRDPNAESVVTLADLASDSDADMLTMVALFENPADVDEWSERFDALPQVLEVRSVAELVPQGQSEKLFILEDLSFVLGGGLAAAGYSQSDRQTLRAAARRLLELLRSDEFESPSQARLRSALETFVAQEPEAGSEALRTLDRALYGNFPAQLARLDQALSAAPFAVDDLPEELRERWIAPDGTQLVEIVPAENIRDNAAASRFVSAVRGVMSEATGLPVVYNEAAGVIVASFRDALTYAVIAIAVILLVFLRSIRDCMIVLIPILSAAVLTAGSTVWLGIPFNFANIIALPLLIGVGVDNAIHMLHRFRSDSAADDTAGSTSLAVFASGLTTIASFGNLAFSSHQGMATMGTLLTIGMIVMMAATLVFLPAILRLGARR